MAPASPPATRWRWVYRRLHHALGENRLFRNLGGKRFEDVTAAMNVAGDAGDYTCAGFFDADDGDLDLIVEATRSGTKRCTPG